MAATLVGSVLALLRGALALVGDAVGGAPLGIGLFADGWFAVAGTAGLMLWSAVRRAENRWEVARRTA